jgi:hypothetical protein
MSTIQSDLQDRLLEGERLRNVQRRDEKWFCANECSESFHSFGRDENGHWQAWHLDREVCEFAEFRMSKDE